MDLDWKYYYYHWGCLPHLTEKIEDHEFRDHEIEDHEIRDHEIGILHLLFLLSFLSEESRICKSHLVRLPQHLRCWVPEDSNNRRATTFDFWIIRSDVQFNLNAI